MPVHCDIPATKISTEEFRDLDYQVMRHAFDSQNELGRLADERIYQADIATRLLAAGFEVRREVEVKLQHGEYSKSLFIDLVVNGNGIYELKTVKALNEAHAGQLLTYLHLIDATRGKLINLRSSTVESRFVNSTIESAQRRNFAINDAEFDSDERFRDVVIKLLRDWGTSLTLSFYRKAVISLLGGEIAVEAMLPVNRKGLFLGRQRFQLASPKTAFTITAMNSDTLAYRSQLSRLISFSDLHSIHWINITLHTVSIATITSQP
jgi:GxxExxY protein